MPSAIGSGSVMLQPAMVSRVYRFTNGNWSGRMTLIALSQWLAENKCTHIAMESTGVYRKPVWTFTRWNGS